MRHFLFPIASQISILPGPDGCLQYFTGTTGTVSSYNFPTTSSTVGSTSRDLK